MIKISKYFIPYIVLLIFMGFKGELLIVFIIVFFHESVHYITARHFGFYGFDVELFPLGTVLKLKELDDASPIEDFDFGVRTFDEFDSGSFFYFMIPLFKSKYINALYMGNITIGIFNLIPAFPLDGGRMVRDILSLKTYYKKANKIMINISIYTGIAMMFIYIVLFFAGKNNFSIGLIALFIIISSLKERERVSFIIMSDIINKKNNFIKKGYIENRSMSIYYKKDLLTALSMVDKNKYDIFTVLDDEMKVMDIIYEGEIIEALKIYGNITINEFVQKDNAL